MALEKVMLLLLAVEVEALLVICSASLMPADSDFDTAAVLVLLSAQGEVLLQEGRMDLSLIHI